VICLGCGMPTPDEVVTDVPVLLHGKFCPTCLFRLGFLKEPPPIVDPGDDRSYDDDDLA
jgi:hypothetical protein